MANFIAIVDPDSGRRAAFLQRVEPLLSPFPRLVRRECQLGDFALVSAAHRDAPIDEWQDDRATAAIWGQAFGPSGPAVTARELAQDKEMWETPSAFDDYHAAVGFRRGAGLLVGADLLRLFPVYYASAADVVLVSSTPDAFRHHPLFRVQLDLSGLAALLLLHSPSQGETLQGGVRRLQPGSVLRADTARGIREIVTYSLPETPLLPDAPFEQHVRLLDAALEEAIARQTARGVAHGLLLSGGRDSRMLAGFLSDLGHRPLAITLGEPDDYEVQCAIPVAATLGFDHRVVPIDPARYVWAAETQIRWEHLGTGFTNIHEWCSVDVCEPLPRFVSGVKVDGVLSMPILGGPSASFEEAFKRMNRSGFTPDLLGRLLKHSSARDVVLTLKSRLRTEYGDPRTHESRRSWHCQLIHWGRFRSGGVLWRQAFGAWPVVPVLDRRVLDLGTGLPAASVAGRRLQDAIFRRRFRRLARIPVVDSNSAIALPIQPTLLERFGKLVRDRLPLLRSAATSGSPGRERRCNYRTADFNGPGWRSVRRVAEPSRDGLADLFDMDVLRGLLPPPEVDVPFFDGLLDSRRLKLLVGLMLWTRNQVR